MKTENEFQVMQGKYGKRFYRRFPQVLKSVTVNYQSVLMSRLA